MNPEMKCPNHRGQNWVCCSLCRAELLGEGDIDGLTKFAARKQSVEVIQRFPLRYADAQASEPGVLDWINRWETGPGDCPSLMIMGQVGVGKTWQAYGALKAAVTGIQTTNWCVTTSADLYASLRPREGVQTESVMEGYLSCGLLLIDDFGVGKSSEWVEEVTYRVINTRYNTMKPIIYTTNCDRTQLAESFGDRIMSRLAETCARVTMSGHDRRRAQNREGSYR